MNARKNEILPVTRTKEDAQASYDRMSSVYDVLIAVGERRYREAVMVMLNAQLGEEILEIGFGTGLVLTELTKKVGEAGRVYGIDLSTGMHTVARSRLSRAHLMEKVSMICGDAVHLPYRRGEFDAVFTSFTLELFDTPEIPRVLEECLRVLKPGGRICAVSLSREGRRGMMTRLYEWGHVRFPKVLDCRPIYLNLSLSAEGFEIGSTKTMPYYGLSVAITLAYKR